MESVLVATLALGLLVACRDQGSPGNRGNKTTTSHGADPSEHTLLIVTLRIRDRTAVGDQVVRFQNAELRALVTKAIHQQPGFTLKEGATGTNPAASRLLVDVELQSLVGSDKAKASALVSLDLARIKAPPDEPGYLGSSLKEKVYRVAELQSLGDLYRTLLNEALGEALRAMASEARLRVAPPPLVIHAIRTARVDELDEGHAGQMDVWQPLALPGQLTLLGDMGIPALAAALLAGGSVPTTSGSEDVDVRELAITIAALRRMKEAVPALLKVLEEEKRERIRDLCLGALAEIGDQRAVPSLTRYSQFGDTDRLRKIIGVLGQIGGTEARAFLEMTADGHDDDDIQKLARETMERLPRPDPRRATEKP